MAVGTLRAGRGYYAGMIWRTRMRGLPSTRMTRRTVAARGKVLTDG